MVITNYILCTITLYLAYYMCTNFEDKKTPKKPKKCKTGVSNIVIEEMYALKKWHPKLNKTNIEKVTEKEKE